MIPPTRAVTLCVSADVSNERVTFILNGSRTTDHSRFLIRIITILTLRPASLVNNKVLSLPSINYLLKVDLYLHTFHHTTYTKIITTIH